MTTSLSPDDCRTMTDVRNGVNRLDRELVELLARRFAFMRAAARIKPNREQVRDEGRKAEVIAAAREAAIELGIPDDFVASVWEQLVETSIAYEMQEWDRLRAHR